MKKLVIEPMGKSCRDQVEHDNLAEQGEKNEGCDADLEGEFILAPAQYGKIH